MPQACRCGARAGGCVAQHTTQVQHELACCLFSYYICNLTASGPGDLAQLKEQSHACNLDTRSDASSSMPQDQLTPPQHATHL